jgi:TolB-like protein
MAEGGEDKAHSGTPPVFISHASQDAPVAGKLCAALEAAGLPCWIAPRDVRAGESYAAEIVQAINSCRMLMLVLSKNAVESSHVLREVERASSKKRPILAVRLDATGLPADFEYFLSVNHWLDASEGPVEEILPALVKAVGGYDAGRPARGAPVAGPIAASAQPNAVPSAAPSTPASRWRIVAIALTLITIGPAFLVANKFLFFTHRSSVTPSAQQSQPLSIVVLPFANRTGDSRQEYLADGLTESIATDLSRISDAVVIDARTAFAYKNKLVSMQQVGSELGVRFVLQGIVQRSGPKIRINAQLADTRNNTQLWSDSFEGDEGDLFGLQDLVTTRIGNSIGREMVKAAVREQRGNPGVGDLILRARAIELEDADSMAKHLKIESLGRQMLTLEPDNPRIMAGLANSLVIQAYNFGSEMDAKVREQKWSEANALLRKALTAGFNTPAVQLNLGLYAASHDDIAGYRRAAEARLALAPRDPAAYNDVANAMLSYLEPDKAIQLLNQAIKLQDPKHPDESFYLNMGEAQFMRSDYDAAIEWFMKTLAVNADYPDAYAYLAMAYALKHADNKARDAVTQLRRRFPSYRLPEQDKPQPSSPAAYKDYWENRVLPAARKAGLVD